MPSSKCLGASSGATRSRTGSNIGGSGKPQTVYAAGFDASWEPSIFGGLRDAADAALADAAAAQASLDSTRASLAAEVALEYITLRASQEAAFYVLNNKRRELDEIEQRYGVRIAILPDGEVEGARMSVEASGIETRAQLEAVAAEGCEWFQGYLSGEPVPADLFESMMRDAGLLRAGAAAPLLPAAIAGEGRS